MYQWSRTSANVFCARAKRTSAEVGSPPRAPSKTASRTVSSEAGACAMSSTETSAETPQSASRSEGTNGTAVTIAATPLELRASVSIAPLASVSGAERQPARTSTRAATVARQRIGSMSLLTGPRKAPERPTGDDTPRTQRNVVVVGFGGADRDADDEEDDHADHDERDHEPDEAADELVLRRLRGSGRELDRRRGALDARARLGRRRGVGSRRDRGGLAGESVDRRGRAEESQGKRQIHEASSRRAPFVCRWVCVLDARPGAAAVPDGSTRECAVTTCEERLGAGCKQRQTK